MPQFCSLESSLTSPIQQSLMHVDQFNLSLKATSIMQLIFSRIMPLIFVLKMAHLHLSTVSMAAIVTPATIASFFTKVDAVKLTVSMVRIFF